MEPIPVVLDVFQTCMARYLIQLVRLLLRPQAERVDSEIWHHRKSEFVQDFGRHCYIAWRDVVDPQVVGSLSTDGLTAFIVISFNLVRGRVG